MAVDARETARLTAGDRGRKAVLALEAGRVGASSSDDEEAFLSSDEEEDDSTGLRAAAAALAIS